MKRLNSIELELPVTEDNKIDTKTIEAIVKSVYGWDIVQKHIMG